MNPHLTEYAQTRFHRTLTATTIGQTHPEPAYCPVTTARFARLSCHFFTSETRQASLVRKKPITADTAPQNTAPASTGFQVSWMLSASHRNEGRKPSISALMPSRFEPVQ